VLTGLLLLGAAIALGVVRSAPVAAPAAQEIVLEEAA
jgi:hypothetical protein